MANTQLYVKAQIIKANNDAIDQCDGDLFNLLKQGNVRLDMKFAQALGNTINVTVSAEFQNILEIDRSRNVLFDYKS